MTIIFVKFTIRKKNVVHTVFFLNFFLSPDTISHLINQKVNTLTSCLQFFLKEKQQQKTKPVNSEKCNKTKSINKF